MITIILIMYELYVFFLVVILIYFMASVYFCVAIDTDGWPSPSVPSTIIKTSRPHIVKQTRELCPRHQPWSIRAHKSESSDPGDGYKITHNIFGYCAHSLYNQIHKYHQRQKHMFYTWIYKINNCAIACNHHKYSNDAINNIFSLKLPNGYVRCG